MIGINMAKKKLKELTLEDIVKHCKNTENCFDCIFCNSSLECEIEFIRLHDIEQEVEIQGADF